MTDPRQIAGALRALADQIDPPHAPVGPPPAPPTTMPRGRDTAPAAYAGGASLYGGGAPEKEPCAPKFGRNAGQPLSTIETRDLQWYRTAILNSLNDPEKAKYRAANERMLRDIDFELTKRQ